MLTSRGLPRDSTCVLKAEPGKLCLLISSLPGKALRTFVDSRGLPRDSTCVLKAEPGKLCLLISSLPGKALRTHVDIERLAEQFNIRSQSRAW